MATADTSSRTKMQTVSLTGLNVVHGTRAHDHALLDRGDSTMQMSDGAGQKGGRKVKHRSTKNNKAQRWTAPRGPCR